MSQTDTTTNEEAPVTEATPEVIETSSAESASTSEETTPTQTRSDRPRGRDGGRPQGRGDRKGPRRDGMREEEKEFKEEMLAVDRVTRVTAGGRQIRFRASVVIGDGKGRIGLGTGKA
jgi:small subunit ribosomal protein S5